MRRRSVEPSEHGAHTLREQDGVIIGIDRDDVFVELGPRMQGVINRQSFPSPPAVGEEYCFTLGGQEESLWALSLSVEPVLATWENLARIIHEHADQTPRTTGTAGLLVPAGTLQILASSTTLQGRLR
ncbi:MAG: hypothetical protein ACI87A_000535, partial [Planctomycetota bacterium]